MQLLKQTSAALVLRVGGAAAQAVTFFLAARIIGLAEVGVFALVASMLLIGRYLGPAGYDQLALRTLSGRTDLTAESRSSAERLASFKVATINLGLTAVAAVIVLILMGLGRPILLWPLVAALVAYWASALSGIFSGILRSREQIIESISGDSFIAPVITLAVMFGLSLLKHLDRDTACLSVAAGALVGMTWQTVHTCLRWRHAYSPAEWAPIFKVRHAVRMWAVQAVAYAQSRFLIFAAALVGGPSLAAIVETAFRISLPPTLAAWSVNAVIGPKLANRADDWEGASALLSFAGVAGLAATAPYLLLFAVFGDTTLVHLLGAKFHAAYWPACVILAGMVVNATFGNYATFLLMNREEGLVLGYTLAAFAVAFVLSIAGGKYFGGIGLAFGFLATNIVRDVGLAVVVNRRADTFKTTWRQLAGGEFLSVLKK